MEENENKMKKIIETKKKILANLEGKEEYQVYYKFSDVIETIEAKSYEEAEKIANKRIGNKKNNPTEDTYCYEIEVEEAVE